MKGSRARILTSQAGSLPRPDDLIELNRARQPGASRDERGYQERLRTAVGDVVRRQKAAGIDVPGDGEYGKAMGQRVNYGAWWSYSFQRLGGLELGMELYRIPARRSEPGRVRLTSFSDRRDRALFHAAYADPDSGVSTNRGGPSMRFPVCMGPLRYTGQEAIRADIAHFRAALAGAGVDDGFMTSIAPGSASRIGNEHYRTEEEFIHACAEAMREEYKAILDAGLVLQLDDPTVAENWDMINPAPSVEEYRKLSNRVGALHGTIRHRRGRRLRRPRPPAPPRRSGREVPGTRLLPRSGAPGTVDPPAHRAPEVGENLLNHGRVVDRSHQMHPSGAASAPGVRAAWHRETQERRKVPLGPSSGHREEWVRADPTSAP